MWNIGYWIKSCSLLLLRFGAVGLSILTIWVLVGSIWFPEWWYIAIWEGEAIHTSYLAYGFSFLLDQERSKLICIVLVAALVTVYLYGSWRESGKAFVLRGFLKSDEFGSRGRQPLRFEQQVVEVAIAASAT